MYIQSSMLNIKIPIYLLPGFLFIFLFACNIDKNRDKPIEVDFSASNNPENQDISTDSIIPLKVAVAAVISPKESFSYYEDLFNYISEKTDRPVEFKQRRTYKEVNVMLENNQVDVAFICGGAYIEVSNKSVDILAVPVCDGKPFYQAYIIVHNSSSINTFEKLRGKSFAFSDPLSNSGKLYGDKRVKESGSTADNFFSKTIYSHAHDISIQLVAKRVVDGATVDGLIYEYQKKFFPGKVKDIKIIEKSEYYGIPPIVTPKATDRDTKSQLREILFNIHNDSAGKKILDKLMVDKFIAGEDSNYNTIRSVCKFVER